jgi:hypothetical protein
MMLVRCCCQGWFRASTQCSSDLRGLPCNQGDLPQISCMNWTPRLLSATRDARDHRRYLLSARALRSLGLGLVLLTAASLVLADPAPAEEHCPASVASPEQARWLADALFEQGAYQRAGICYEAAGEHALANKAFLKAVGPQSSTTTRQLSEQRDQAKALFRQLQQAFNPGH